MLRRIVVIIAAWCLFAYASVYAQPVPGPGVPGAGSDITDVYDCALGDCDSITMSTGDLLDMSGATPANTSGLILPDAADCSAVTVEGGVCWDSVNNQLVIGDGATQVTIGVGTGDITAVFACSSGSCTSITMGASDFLDMSGATPANTSGLKLPDATSCAAATGEGVVCWDSDNDQLYIGDGATANAIGGAGGSGDITDVFNCATGNCSAITMASSDFLDMSGAAPTNASGLKLPTNTTCDVATGEGVVCWDSDNDELNVGDGTTVKTFMANAGDIDDVFGCAAGDCSSVAVADGDLLDFSGCDPDSAGECLVLPQNASSCASLSTEGQLCWGTNDKLLYVHDGTGAVAASAGTLDQAFDNGKLIDGANSQANGLRVGDGTDYWEFYIGASGCQQACVVGGSPTDYTINISTGNDFILDCDGVDCLTISDTGAVTLGADLLEWKIKDIPLSMCSVVDGSQNTQVTIGGLTHQWTTTLTDADTSTIICEVRADPAWNEAGLKVILSGVLDGTDILDGDVNADVSMVCVGNNESTTTLTFGTEFAIDLDIDGGSFSDEDNIETALTTLVVTGCNSGDRVYIRYQIDATGTTVTDVTELNFRWMHAYFAYNTWSN